MKKLSGLLCAVALLFSLVAPCFAVSVCGDADGDGSVTPADARLVLRIAVGLEPAEGIAVPLDVDLDGDVTPADARLVLRRSVGLEKLFPAEMPFTPPIEGESPDVAIDAPRALLYDATDNRLLFRKNIDEKTAPASVIKLLTALTALKYCAPDDVFTVGDEIDLIGKDSSVSDLKKGWRLTLEQLLYGMMLPSGNDAAYCVAVNVARTLGDCPDPREAVARFASLMNETTLELGMTDTCVVSPDGYDAPGQYTTARDLLTLARAALQNELLTAVCGTFETTFTPAGEENPQTWKNTNRYLNPEDRFYDPHVFGLKGGYTEDAGCCLLSAWRVNGRDYIVLLMGLDSFNARYHLSSLLVNAVEPDEITVPPENPPEEPSTEDPLDGEPTTEAPQTEEPTTQAAFPDDPPRDEVAG